VGAFFFCVSSVVTNARSARTIGPSVEELTCSKSQCRGSRHLISVNGGDMLCFDQCTIGNVNAPASPVKQAFYGMTDCDSWESTMVPEAKHTGWRKNLYLASPYSACDGPSIVNLTKPDTSHSSLFSLSLDWCDCLDWNQISAKKIYHNYTRHSSLKRVKSSFSRFTSWV
jgi:hypothetical protein